MPPEQILGEDLDQRADIYAFGASAYEIVTLKTPFVGLTAQDLLNKHLTEKPLSPVAHNPDVTEDFAKLVLHMLAKRKQDRPSNMHEVLMKLKTIRVFKSQTIPPGPRK
jgi:serine/threonine protein kinase